jgi:hypothetical protein
MTGAWVSLQEAVETVRAASVENPEEVIRQAVSVALLVRPGTLPLSDHTPPAPRLHVITQRTIVGMDWLQAPALDFEKSEILCRSYMAGTWEEWPPQNLHPARIEIWKADLLRLWPSGGSQEAPGERTAADHKPLPSPRDTAEEACRKLIVSLDDSGLTKAVIFDRARKEIRDLQLVEFDRAWFNGANHLKKRGRRKASN